MQEKKVINESKVSIEVEWWDECIVEVMQDLENECGQFYTVDDIYNYAAKKYIILGRPLDDIDDIVILHIKDLIYQHHGDGFVVGAESPSDTELHTKAVVIQELADVIWKKVMEKTNDDTIETPQTRLVDKDKLITMDPILIDPDEDYPGENCENLPWEYCSEVKGFWEYRKEILENKNICLDNTEELFEDAVEKIIAETGSLRLEDIQKYLKNRNENSAKEQTVYDYIWNKVLESVKKKGEYRIKTKGKEMYSPTPSVVKQVLKLHASLIVDEIMTIIETEGGLTDAKKLPPSI